MSALVLRYSTCRGGRSAVPTTVYRSPYFTKQAARLQGVNKAIFMNNEFEYGFLLFDYSNS
eukprot:1585089-Prymnesium_polylepis.6